MWNIKNFIPIAHILSKRYVCFIGAGGKTSYMDYIAGLFLNQGKTVVATTTTKIWAKEPYSLIQDTVVENMPLPFARIGKTIEEGKLSGLSFDEVERLGKRYDIVLIEADGAKGMPLKFPAHYEPVIPPFADMIFVLSGLDSLFKKANEVVFRWNSFCDKKGTDIDSIITPELFLDFFTKDALLKDVDLQNALIVLNKYDLFSKRDLLNIIEMAKKVINRTGVNSVVISSLLYKIFYIVTH